MLEILSHQYLKRFMKSHYINWENVYSFGRIISKFIQGNETYLINSEIFSTKDWLSSVLITLFLYEEDSTFVLSNEKIEFLKENHTKVLKTLGFDYIFDNDHISFANHKVHFITLNNLISNSNSLGLKNHRFIFSGIEDIKQDLKNYYKITLFKEDWFLEFNQFGYSNQNIIRTYNLLKKKFFLRKVLGNRYLLLDKKEIHFLSKFFCENASFSKQFSRVGNALSQGWACWVELDNVNLEWNFHIEPIDELLQIRELLVSNKFIYLSALRKDNFFQKYLKNQGIEIDLVINFKSNFSEKKIQLYVPPNQMLPNNPFFTKEILRKCNKLIIFRRGLTLILSDDVDLKTNLAIELASKHGKTVLLETIPSLNQEILCASYNWWIKNACLIRTPDQIIIPLLPIPNVSEPINSIIISHYKKLSKDWFREYLLPEAGFKLERSVAPLRRNSGKLIILDGRAKKRKWGRSLLKDIEPSKQIKYMLPFD